MLAGLASLAWLVTAIWRDRQSRASRRYTASEEVQQLQRRCQGSTLRRTSNTWHLELADAPIQLEVDLHKARLRCRGRFPLPAGPHFTIRPKALAGVHARHVVFRDAALDRCFALDSPTPRFTQQVWSSQARELLAPLPEIQGPQRHELLAPSSSGNELRSNGKAVVLTRSVAEDDWASVGELSERAIALIRELTRDEVFGLDELRALPDAASTTVDDLPCVRLPLEAEVLLGPCLREGRACTCAWVSGHAEVAASSSELGSDAARAILPAGAAGVAAELGEGTLERSGRMTCFWFRGIEREPRRLLAAARLVAAFAAPGTPYR